MSVGHLAKAQLAAAAEAAEDGEALARNALGKAAATIAKMTFDQRAALLAPAPAPEPEPAPEPTPEPVPDPTTGTETPADPAIGTETPGEVTSEGTSGTGSSSTPDPTSETVTLPVDPATDPAVTLLDQMLADAEAASEGV
jgi:hypothetical protein